MSMGADDAKKYDATLETWVSEHPFLIGGSQPSSAVFDAMISAHALKSKIASGAALQRELSRGSAANPFLSEFYFSLEGNSSERTYLPPGHIGVVYASLRARLSIGDSATLEVEGNEEAEEEEALFAEVEITHSRRDVDQPRILSFISDQTSSIRLGPHIGSINISVPFAEVEIGTGSEVVLIAPINIQCDKLKFEANRVVIEAPSSQETGDSLPDVATVYLEASEFVGPNMNSVPVLRNNVSLAVCWPNSSAYPWTNFAIEPTPIPDPRTGEALRRLRKFVIVFQSHKRNELGKYSGKIENYRMTKGNGQAVLDLMKADGILRLVRPMYFLNPDKLAESTGLSYSDCMRRKFGPQSVAFVHRALQNINGNG